MRETIKDIDRLQHILEISITLLESKEQYSFEEVQRSPILYFGFVKHVEMIGEAVYMLTKDFRETHTEVPWRDIEAMRHILVHGYYAINPHQLWQVVEQDIPIIKPFIEKYITEQKNSNK